MIRTRALVMAAVLAGSGTVGCTFCDTCDDFPIPMIGGAGYGGMAPPPMMGAPVMAAPDGSFTGQVTVPAEVYNPTAGGDAPVEVPPQEMGAPEAAPESAPAEVTTPAMPTADPSVPVEDPLVSPPAPDAPVDPAPESSVPLSGTRPETLPGVEPSPQPVIPPSDAPAPPAPEAP